MRPWYLGPRFFRGYQTCQRLLGNPLVRNSYNISIRCRILKSRDFWSKMALFGKIIFKNSVVSLSAALAKMPIGFWCYFGCSTTGFYAWKTGTIVHNFFTFSV